ncbi:hypothetical protein HOLleu_19255 [Holothuria leucospilota]|uniref:Uncharacterized protein n=1 Tax=Holothuria leucospilota TaxID=206669 RepID=A0A9Q1BZK4_HOLLE|nr:hypothetical protein HOLleu_19255 [Holothuria leucospilota]
MTLRNGSLQYCSKPNQSCTGSSFSACKINLYLSRLHNFVKSVTTRGLNAAFSETAKAPLKTAQSAVLEMEQIRVLLLVNLY